MPAPIRPAFCSQLDSRPDPEFLSATIPSPKSLRALSPRMNCVGKALSELHFEMLRYTGNIPMNAKSNRDQETK
jgi:hypothetical protein